MTDIDKDFKQVFAALLFGSDNHPSTMEPVYLWTDSEAALSRIEAHVAELETERDALSDFVSLVQFRITSLEGSLERGLASEGGLAQRVNELEADLQSARLGFTTTQMAEWEDMEHELHAADDRIAELETAISEMANEHNGGWVPLITHEARLGKLEAALREIARPRGRNQDDLPAYACELQYIARRALEEEA